MTNWVGFYVGDHNRGYYFERGEGKTGFMFGFVDAVTIVHAVVKPKIMDRF